MGIRKIVFSSVFLLTTVLLVSTTSAQSTYPDTLHTGRLRGVILAESAFYAAGLSYLQFVWYRDRTTARDRRALRLPWEAACAS
ncbi:MAG: hypothetical protein AAF223_20125, partial [Bacteroidota bacterium]